MLKAEKKALMEKEKLKILERKEIVLGESSCKGGRGRLTRVKR